MMNKIENVATEEMQKEDPVGALQVSEILPETLINKVHELVGQASMCWQHIERAGVFKSEMALHIASELLIEMAKYKLFVLRIENAFDMKGENK